MKGKQFSLKYYALNIKTFNFFLTRLNILANRPNIAKEAVLFNNNIVDFITNVITKYLNNQYLYL